ncbi:MAG: DHH family phosphoesterase [Bacteroidia bacterium]
MTLAQLQATLAQPQHIVITTHKSPDGDAMGSSLGLYHFLTQLNHTVTVVTPNEYPVNLHWLPNNDKVVIATQQPEKAAELIANATLIFTLDFNNLLRIDQLAKLVEQAVAPKVMIDHHLEPSNYAAFMLSDTSASSTCELIYVFMQMMERTDLLNKQIAECLYTGILTDTGCFKYYSCTDRTHAVVSHLVAAGVKNQELHERIFDADNINRKRLHGYAVAHKMYKMESLPVIITSLTSAELDEYNYETGNSDGIVNVGLGISGVKLSAFFVERDGAVKISFRSKGGFNVNEFSRKHFSGGGHANAAGGGSEVSLQETIKQFETIIPTYANELFES